MAPLNRVWSMGWVTTVVLCMGCSTTPPKPAPEVLPSSVQPAYSLSLDQPDIIVAVSPVRQTLQIGGSLPTLLGASISAIQDSHYKAQLREALGDFDANGRFEQVVREKITAIFPQTAIRVAPVGSAAGYANIREAATMRLSALAKKGYDCVLDLDLSYGIFGPEGILAARIDGTLADPKLGKILWRNTISAYTVEMYADMRPGDPMERLTPRYLSPRLSTAADAISQWTTDGGQRLIRSLEDSFMGVISAVVTDMGVEETALGHYVLGVQSLFERDATSAEAHFSRAIALDPSHWVALQGLAVAKARNGHLEEAIQDTKVVLEHSPTYLPALYNLAWWYAVELKQPDAARPYFEKATTLGARPSRKLNQAMGIK